MRMRINYICLTEFGGTNMTIGEKITHLRIANGISQEKLATMLNVSRQSISKWESDESLPQIDKILEFCQLFKISTDEMLKDALGAVGTGKQTAHHTAEHSLHRST